MPKFATITLALVALSIFAAACATAPRSEYRRTALHENVQEAIADFQRKDPQIEELFETAHGYAVFPSIGKGAVGVGGAYGRGLLYEQGEPVGYCDVSQGTIGFQLGGQAYSQVIFFENERAINEFKYGDFAFAAQASAVAAYSGAAANARYSRGVMVFTMARGGLMYEASIGGQRFSFRPIEPQ